MVILEFLLPSSFGEVLGFGNPRGQRGNTKEYPSSTSWFTILFKIYSVEVRVCD